VRDPRGTVASQALMPWDEPDVAVPAAIARWEAAISRTDTFAAQLRPDQLLDVRYEDMVSEPYREVERICAFAGLRAGDALELMISDEHRERVRGALHQRTAEPVNTVSVERWRERLTPEQVVLVEGATVDLRERFGYPAAGDISAEPTPADTRELARQRRKFRRLWRRSRGGDVLRKALYRRPVTAERNHP
jgi:hypothetical protein